MQDRPTAIELLRAVREHLERGLESHRGNEECFTRSRGHGLDALSHQRRKVIHFNVTENPTAQWVAQQMVEAFPWDSAPKYLLRDRDAIFGETFRRRVAGSGYRRSINLTAESLAKSLRRTADWNTPSRVF